MISRFLESMLLLLLFAGCALIGPQANFQGPTTTSTVVEKPWTFDKEPAHIVCTTHYRIFTTIEDSQLRQSLGQLMEGGLEQYRQFVPDLPVVQQPMDCFIFLYRPQWAEFTQKITGSDATVYLQIHRGGYTAGGRFVAYFVGDMGTWSVAAHEGWHQFVARNFHGRLPPFLDEGMACTFENLHWANGLPRWDLTHHPGRAMALRLAIHNQRLWPTDQLIKMHAGDAVTDPRNRVDAFYAQCWAFARFLCSADGGKYRPALEHLLMDTALGTVYDPTGSHQDWHRPWRPDGVQPMLEHYLDMDLAHIDKAYQVYMHMAAYEELED